MPALEIYRSSAIGRILIETLDEMVYSGRLAPELAIQVLLQFDKSMNAALKHEVTGTASFRGNLHTYRFCDCVWTFNLRDVKFENEEMLANIDKLKIVACDSRLRKLDVNVPPQQ